MSEAFDRLAKLAAGGVSRRAVLNYLTPCATFTRSPTRQSPTADVRG